jgi:PAS domain S-box-containing protein
MQSKCIYFAKIQKRQEKINMVTGANTLDDWKEQFYQIFKDSLIGIAILDSNGVFLEVNDKACAIWGWQREELIGKSWRDITHPEDIEKSTHYVSEYEKKSSKYCCIMEKRYVNGTGGVVYCKITTSCIRKPDGSIRCFITHIEDVSHKKLVMELIEKSRVAIQKILDR